MSAESPRHARAGGGGGGGVGGGGPLMVAPQPPSDRSLIDTVSGFISDVTLAGTPPADHRDTIQWARFETADVNEPVPESDSESELSPLLLVLGYGSGVQVWLIRAGGEAQEVLSWRQGSVRALRVLPTPGGRTVDAFASKRPLLALCDSAAPGPLFCSLSFISVRGGDQVKSIKFKNPILDVLANKRSVVVSFCERFAVFDAGTLEDRLAVTTCYPCPCPLGGASPLNPLALGDRWLAYADKKLNVAKRSSGGCEGEGASSYTASVLHAAKSLSKGLRGLGESVASSLAGARALSQSPSPPSADQHQPGVVTVLDIEGGCDEEGAEGAESAERCDATVAHFVAHPDAIIALKFDASGMLLVTADKRGHDFHLFRLQPHPCGPALAAVHHLYVLHRGDTTARVQDIALSTDGRWAAVSTLRGTTHVFPISPYGGACGVRTHTQPRVVNRLSRFHRSAGLPIHPHQASSHAHARSGSPVGDGAAQGAWFPNPRLPPYPLPTVVSPLAQLRPSPAPAGIPTHTITRNSSGRQRLSSVSEEGAGAGAPLLACARWGAAGPAAPAAHPATPPRAPAAHALYVMAATGHLLHYLIHPRPAAGVAKEKVCEDTPVELEVELAAQWPLGRPAAAPDLAAPLRPDNPLLHRPDRRPHKRACEAEEAGAGESEEERWLAQVEIVTHAGPHRRLWMGPQFVFKTYNNPAALSGSRSSLLEAEAVEVELGGGAGAGGGGPGGGVRSPPVNMPGARPLVPVLIDSGSASSLEHSPSDSFRRKSYLLEAGAKEKTAGAGGGGGDVQLREDLAEAMRDTEQGGEMRPGGACGTGGWARRAGVVRAVDPLGTVVAPPGGDPEPRRGEPDDPDLYTHSNSDEALFRPVVRADASLSPHAHLPLATHLPPHTTIPVQSISPDAENAREAHTPSDHPLSTNVVIPAALTTHDDRSLTGETAHELSQPQPYEGFYDPPPSTTIGISRQVTADNTLSDVQEIARPEPPEEAFVELTVMQPMMASEQESVTDKTEEQMWAMLSEDLDVHLDVDTIISEVKKIAAEVKPKPRRSKKNKTRSAVEVVCSTPQHEETIRDEIIINTKSSSVRVTTTSQDSYECKTKECKKKYENFEEIVNLESNGQINTLDDDIKGNNSENVPKEFFKAKSSSPDISWKRSRPNKQSSGSEKEKDTLSRSSGSIDRDQRRSPPALHSLHLPEDFDSYFLKKDKTDEGLHKSKSKSYTGSAVQELIDDSMFLIESSSKINSAVLDDSVAIEITKPTGMTNRHEEKQYSLLDDEFGTKFEASISKAVVEELDEYPIISSRRSTRTKREPTQQPPETPDWTINAFSYSSVASKGCVSTEVPGLELAEPCRPSLRDKLAELCKRSDVAVAECDAPGTHLPCLEELPPLEPLHFTLEDFKLDVMQNDNDADDTKMTAPIFKINIDQILHNLEVGARCEEGGGGEGSMVASDEEGVSPVSSQTDSDERVERRRVAAVAAARPAKAPARKKSKKKRK